ncbi:hypothetical protein PDIG_85070 [Penicillium digitatum PHI26]|uniref:Uncharacterized protein n=3 Tax=Penicillium digitatum TaxID=36651 RepID=K9FVF3_PEND2|nr:hypothetical protein PDIP_22730 [Penicillium digitatum Pd1]EKV05051.1 hypothetical protein PDIG_85070 [Penicillium digitatum PHI26]EKV19611.1 hypothetical protein PDIP_22730 [Penicillium digitatum Pd1]
MVMFYPPCFLAAASLLVTFIVSILNFICYATSKASPDVASTILSTVGCVALIALGLLHHQDIQVGCQQWICFTGGYLLVAAAVSAGAMTMSPQTSVFVVRSVFWALSVFAQGFFCGFLAMTLAQEKSNPKWPRPYFQEVYSQEPKGIHQSPGFLPSPLDAKEEKHASIDTSSSAHFSPSPSPTQDRRLDTLPDQDTRPLLLGTHNVRGMPSLRRNPPTALSLASLVHPPMPSPTASTIRVDSLTQSTSNSSTWAYTPFGEDNIHPLFRSTSPCPSPTFAPGTMVKALPSAGQTITAGTITRMQSAHSLRDQVMCIPSPFPGLESEEILCSRPNPTRGGFAEKRHDWNESPCEK